MAGIGTVVSISYARTMGSGRSRKSLNWCLVGIPMLLCSLAISAASATPVTVVDWLGTAEGLPNPDVEAVVRDRAGYVWIGTRGGLVRHEGVRLNVLRRDPDRPGALPGDNVLTLMAADDGDVWAAISEQGIVRIRGVQVIEQWANARDGGPLQGRYVWSLSESCDGAVWGAYATDGLVRIDPDSSTTTHFAPGQLGLPDSGFGLQLTRDAACRLWLLRTDGVWQVRTAEPFGFERVLAAEDSGMLMFLSMLLAQGDRAFVTGSGGLLDVELGEAAEDKAQINEFWELDESVNVARPADDGSLWLGMRRGLMLFDPATGQSRPLHLGPDNGDLSAVQISDVMSGAEGDVWIATTGSGVARLPPGWRGFHPIVPRLDEAEIKRVTSIATGPDGALWLGSANHGVQQLDPDSGAVLPPGIRTGAQNNEVVGLHVTEQAVWSLDRRRLIRGDLATGESTALIERLSDGEDHFEFLLPADDGDLWLGGEDAYLLRLDSSGKVLDRWDADAEIALDRRIGASSLRTMRRGPDGHWWLLSADAVYRQVASGAFIEVWRAEDAALVTMAFQGSRLWLAADSTLESFRVDGATLAAERRFTAGSGLPAGRVQALVPRGDDLWLLMSIGLARLDTDRGEFRLFSAREGLMQSEFNPEAVVELADGRLAAGTNNGLLVFDPAEIQPAPRPPPVHLISMRAGDRMIGLERRDAAPLEFGWEDNSMEFSFLALSYINPTQNRYRARLSGWEDEWQELVGQTTRFFSNLPSGEYTFEVQAANVEGAWNRAGDRVTFSIAAPPWRSAEAWAAYTVVLLAMLAIVWRAFVVRRRRRESIRRAEQQRQLADRQRDLMERLNRSLEPDDVAGTIGTAVVQLTGASVCHVGFMQSGFPKQVRSFGEQGEPPTRADFDAAVSRDGPGELLHLGTAGKLIAAVWLPELDVARRRELRTRLDLFAQTAGQVLENARLLLDVRELAHHADAASAAKSDFLATMSHEIRTPLHGLLGMMELIEQAETDPAQLDMLRTMRGSGRQLQRILNDVLDLSRIEAGRVELDRRPFELGPLLERVIDLHAPNAFASGLALRLRIAADLPLMAIGDDDRIAQIVGNLVSNAIKFTVSGWVELDARLDADRTLVLSVSDSGPGIDAAVQTELFEPFTQIGSASTRKHSGTGLGLAISRRLVDAMDGTMALESEPGRGSRFTVRLPLPGMQRQPPFAPALLQDFRLAVALPAAERRVLLRLARRWSIDMLRGHAVDVQNEPFDALVYREGQLEPDLVSAFRARGVACWLVGDEAAGSLEAAARLRAPLIESRLIGALLDFRFSRVAAD